MLLHEHMGVGCSGWWAPGVTLKDTLMAQNIAEILTPEGGRGGDSAKS